MVLGNDRVAHQFHYVSVGPFRDGVELDIFPRERLTTPE